MKKLLLISALLIFACSSDDGSNDNNNNNPSNCDVVYLDANGVTIKACDDANIGDVGTINGMQYTVVDREMLDQMLLNEEDVSKVCTSKITDMRNLFSDNLTFNQPIGNWDVSNVTDMNRMFRKASSFNQDLSNWDTSNVTDCQWSSDYTQQWALSQPNFINCNPMGIITTVEVTLSDGTNSYLLSFEDMDGSFGPEEGVYNGATMSAGSYSGDIQMYNKSVHPNNPIYVRTDILDENETTRIQFFFNAVDSNNFEYIDATFEYNDMDLNGYSVGQQFIMNVSTSTGNFQLIEIIDLDKTATGVLNNYPAIADGIINSDLYFPITIN